MAYKVEYKLWVSSQGVPFLGTGRIALIKAIDEMGSLNKAAKALNISYKKAWELITSVNEAATEPILISSKGGSGGGGMHITSYGKTIIKQYEALQEQTNKFMNQLNFTQ